MTPAIATSHTRPIARRRDAPKKWIDADEFRWAVRDWSVKIGVHTPSVHFRAMTTKWASISTRGRLTADTSLLTIPRELGEFVIVHELVHLLAPNHGKLFKSFMLAYLPDWEQRYEALRLRAARKSHGSDLHQAKNSRSAATSRRERKGRAS